MPTVPKCYAFIVFSYGFLVLYNNVQLSTQIMMLKFLYCLLYFGIVIQTMCTSTNVILLHLNLPHFLGAVP